MFSFVSKMAKSKIVGGMLLIAFLGALAFSLFTMSGTGMDMSGGNQGCPFMVHEATLCSMSVLDHIGVWQSSFLTTIPSFSLLLLVLLGAVVLLSATPPNQLIRKKYLSFLPSKYFIKRVYSCPYRPLQELFSSGILHPKLYPLA